MEYVSICMNCVQTITSVRGEKDWWHIRTSYRGCDEVLWKKYSQAYPHALSAPKYKGDVAAPMTIPILTEGSCFDRGKYADMKAGDETRRLT